MSNKNKWNLVDTVRLIKYESLGPVLTECPKKPVYIIDGQRLHDELKSRTDHSPHQMLRLYTILTLSNTDRGTDQSPNSRFPERDFPD